jgi:galacturonokinase
VEFPDIIKEKERLVESFVAGQKGVCEIVRVVVSPYRICPLGAHIDHQGGSVLGMTINASTLMAFCPTKDRTVSLTSKNYPGEVNFELGDIGESPGSFWGVYPRAAVLALQEKYPLKVGISGLLYGMLPGCGLSSSASVLLAYLHAFADVNDLQLDPWEYVHLTHKAEKKYIGLNNGILDQTSIVFGRKKELLHIDTRNIRVSRLPDTMIDEYRILVAFSGYSRELTTSGYNSRVDECKQAAEQLSRMAGKEHAEILSDVNREDYARFGSELDAVLAKRSTHYFNESLRVEEGTGVWQERDIAKFGQLMNESCTSSMEKYECGIQPIYDLQQIVSSTEGVYGSRFMGGGFGGCVVGLVKPTHAELAAKNIEATYKQLHPEVADKAAVYLARSDDGVRFI